MPPSPPPPPPPHPASSAPPATATASSTEAPKEATKESTTTPKTRLSPKINSTTTATTMSSWLDIPPESDFTLSNIPFGICSFPEACPKPIVRPRCCTAIGQYAVDLYVLAEAGLFEDAFVGFEQSSPCWMFGRPVLNDFMRCDREVWVRVRDRIIELFVEYNNNDDDGGDDDGEQYQQRTKTNTRPKSDPILKNDPSLRSSCLQPLSTTRMHLPASVGDYTDFYSSRSHATNVGIMFRGKDNALQPNWLHLPVAYHGRSSTLYASGTHVRRPCGQIQADANDVSKGSVFGPSKLLDFELEVAFFVGGKANDAGTRLTIEEARRRIFGYVLMNDWSARDVQKWEYVPLGPFGSKNFGTTISPWVVTPMALEPYRRPLASEAGTKAGVVDGDGDGNGDGGGTTTTKTNDRAADPIPLEYLRDTKRDSYDVTLEVSIKGENMVRHEVVCTSNLTNLYWTAAQQLAHHSVTGCVMNAGDLLASGTISGPEAGSFGSLLELSWRGSRNVKLGESSESRKFLRDGDSVVIRGWCGGNGNKSGDKFGKGGGSSSDRVGFGVCEGTVLPAIPDLEAGSASSSNAASAAEVPPDAEDRYRNFKLYSYWRSSSSWRVRVALESKRVQYDTVPVNLLKSDQQSKSHEGVNAMSQVPVLECVDSVTGRTIRLTQSLVMIDFLEEAFPRRGGSLLPRSGGEEYDVGKGGGGGPVDPADRAAALEMAEIVNSGTQPLQNLAVVRKIDAEYAAGGGNGAGAGGGRAFAREAIERGLRALERLSKIRRSERGGATTTTATATVEGGKKEGEEEKEKEKGSSVAQCDGCGPYVLGTFSPTIADACVVPQLYNARRYEVDVDSICPTLVDAEKAALRHPWFVRSHPDNQPDAVFASSTSTTQEREAGREQGDSSANGEPLSKKARM